jgi:hypothetical protein
MEHVEEERNNVYRYMVGSPERKKSLGRLRHRRRNNIKMKHKEV